MTFKDFITDVNKMTGTIAGLALVTGMLFATYSHFYTDAEAAVHILAFEDYQQQQIQSDKNRRIDELERQIGELDITLLNNEITNKKREYLKRRRDDLERKIQCIRRNEC